MAEVEHFSEDSGQRRYNRGLWFGMESITEVRC